MVLVTGATGLVGAHLLYALAQKKEKIRAIYRSEERLGQVEKIFGYYTANPKELTTIIEWVQCDITDVEKLRTAFDSIEKVYHCAAYISFDPSHLGKLQKSNVEGTANIVNLCIEHRIKKLCHVSSIATLGTPKKGGHIDEESEWNPMDASVYALTKYDAEMEVWRGTQEGVPAVIVNPGVILGPGQWHRGSGALFGHNSKKRSFYLPGGTGFIGVRDVVKTMLLLVESGIENERYILVSNNLSFKEVQSKIAKGFNLPPATIGVRPWQLELFWRWDWLKSTVTRSKRVLSRSVAKSLCKTDRYGNKKIREALGITFEALDEVISFSCASYLDDHQA